MFRTYFLLGLFFLTLGLGACSSMGDRQTASDSDDSVDVYRPKNTEVRGAQ